MRPHFIAQCPQAFGESEFKFRQVWSQGFAEANPDRRPAPGHPIRGPIQTITPENNPGDYRYRRHMCNRPNSTPQRGTAEHRRFAMTQSALGKHADDASLVQTRNCQFQGGAISLKPGDGKSVHRSEIGPEHGRFEQFIHRHPVDSASGGSRKKWRVEMTDMVRGQNPRSFTVGPLTVKNAHLAIHAEQTSAQEFCDGIGDPAHAGAERVRTPVSFQLTPCAIRWLRRPVAPTQHANSQRPNPPNAALILRL